MSDVKYKDPVKIQSRPVVLSCNGHYFEELFKWYPAELSNFRTRCVSLHMDIPLHSRISEDCLDGLRFCGDELLHCLYPYRKGDKGVAMNALLRYS